MKLQSLIQQILQKRSYLCVGIDPDEKLLPNSLSSIGIAGIEKFCLSIIDATAPFCVAFKPNFAFFEAFGADGFGLLEIISGHIRKKHPHHFLIADAKRGDIGNTSARYAEAILTKLNFDAITVSPYMGEDSVKPFFLEGKWVILLMLTSNKGSENFQKLSVGMSGEPLYVEVGRNAMQWGNTENLMFVTGATHPDELKKIRQLFRDYFLLIPGVGAQGGSLLEVSQSALNESVGILVNSSRGIIHSSSAEDYLEQAVLASSMMQKEMEEIMRSKGLVQ
ncbi:MAG: hypothetical protein RLZZ46_946 [Bacteroidota bacterium]|jgi:orotidine-5'-phosphate decarboxylase